MPVLSSPRLSPGVCTTSSLPPGSSHSSSSRLHYLPPRCHILPMQSNGRPGQRRCVFWCLWHRTRYGASSGSMTGLRKLGRKLRLAGTRSGSKRSWTGCSGLGGLGTGGGWVYRCLLGLLGGRASRSIETYGEVVDRVTEQSSWLVKLERTNRIGDSRLWEMPLYELHDEIASLSSFPVRKQRVHVNHVRRLDVREVL